jgi:hypothetical protein
MRQTLKVSAPLHSALEVPCETFRVLDGADPG